MSRDAQDVEYTVRCPYCRAGLSRTRRQTIGLASAVQPSGTVDGHRSRIPAALLAGGGIWRRDIDEFNESDFGDLLRRRGDLKKRFLLDIREADMAMALTCIVTSI